MKTSSITFALLGSLFALTACSGAEPGEPTASEPGAETPRGSALGTPGPAEPGAAAPGNGAPPATPPATTPPATTPPPPADPPMPKHCDVTSVSGKVCLENAQGRAGDVVEIAVVLLGGSGCAIANEANGRFSYDYARFEIQNPADVQECRTRRVGPDPVDPAKSSFFWGGFGENVVPGCADIPIGRVDTIRLKIAAGTPPGDYDVTALEGGVVGGPGTDVACSDFGAASVVGGVIRVLP